MKRQILSCILNKTDDVLYGLLAALHLGHVWKEGVCFLLQQNKTLGLLGLCDNNLHNFTCLSDKNWYVKESLRQHRIPGHSFDLKHARLRIIVKGIVYSKNYISSSFTHIHVVTNLFEFQETQNKKFCRMYRSFSLHAIIMNRDLSFKSTIKVILKWSIWFVCYNESLLKSYAAQTEGYLPHQHTVNWRIVVIKSLSQESGFKSQIEQTDCFCEATQVWFINKLLTLQVIRITFVAFFFKLKSPVPNHITCTEKSARVHNLQKESLLKKLTEESHAGLEQHYEE